MLNDEDILNLMLSSSCTGLNMNESEDEYGWSWDKLCWLNKGDNIDGFYIDASGWALIHKTQGRAPDGGTYAETSSDVIMYGCITPEQCKELLKYAKA